MSHRIIAFDPGGTTGYKLYDSEADTFSGGQLEPNHHFKLWSMLNNLKINAVVYETFEYRNKSRAGLVLDSREYIGIIRLFEEMYSISTTKQTPAQAKGFVSDDRLKRGGLWVPGHPHENDACRHLIYYMINTTSALPDKRKELLESMYK